MLETILGLLPFYLIYLFVKKLKARRLRKQKENEKIVLPFIVY